MRGWVEIVVDIDNKVSAPRRMLTDRLERTSNQMPRGRYHIHLRCLLRSGSNTLPISIPNPLPRNCIEPDSLVINVERLEHELHGKLL